MGFDFIMKDGLDKGLVCVYFVIIVLAGTRVVISSEKSSHVKITLLRVTNSMMYRQSV